MVWPGQKSEELSYLEIVFPVTNCIPNSENDLQMSSAKMPPQTPVYIIEEPTYCVPGPQVD